MLMIYIGSDRLKCPEEQVDISTCQGAQGDGCRASGPWPASQCRSAWAALASRSTTQ